MIFVGITGGVGAGKSRILDYMQERWKACIIKSDDLAAQLMEPGTDLYNKMREVFSSDNVYDDKGILNRQKMAEIVFSNPEKLKILNGLVHPAVKEEVGKIKEKLEKDKKYDYLILEAALLIEDNYDKLCDEIWYIYADEETRKKRLVETRNYSEEKIAGIMAKQLSDGEFRKCCKRYINNSGDFSRTMTDIDVAMESIKQKRMQGAI